MNIHESAENYLETIYMLSMRGNGNSVRAIDIAVELGYSKPSVSVAMKNLRQNGYITTASDGGLLLTDIGLAIALKMYERHTLLSTWLMRIGVSEETALHDACRIEHVISEEAFEALKREIQS